jgi:hypothetical protein
LSTATSLLLKMEEAEEDVMVLVVLIAIVSHRW